MQNRIKELRKELNLTQQEFADKIGTSRNNIAGYEVGSRIPSDAVISLICKTLNIREDWLRTGNGEKTIESTHDNRFSMNLSNLQNCNDETIIRWVNTIAETNPEALKEIENFMKRLLGIDI